MTAPERIFITHLLPADLRAAYPATVPSDYITALHPEISAPTNVTDTIIDFAIAWLAARLRNGRLAITDERWISDMAGEIHYHQDSLFGRPADAEVSRAVYRALGDIYGMEPRQYNDNDLPSVFAILLYLTPESPGNYPTDAVYYMPARYTQWARVKAAEIMSHIDKDLSGGTQVIAQ